MTGRRINRPCRIKQMEERGEKKNQLRIKKKKKIEDYINMRKRDRKVRRDFKLDRILQSK